MVVAVEVAVFLGWAMAPDMGLGMARAMVEVPPKDLAMVVEVDVVMVKVEGLVQDMFMERS